MPTSRYRPKSNRRHTQSNKTKRYNKHKKTRSNSKPARFRSVKAQQSRSRSASKLTKNLTKLGIIEKSLNELIKVEDFGVSWSNDHNCRTFGAILSRTNVAGENFQALGAFSNMTRGDEAGSVGGDYIYANNINLRLEIRMNSVYETITQLKDNLQMCSAQRFRVMLVFPKLSAQNVNSANFSVTDSLFLDWGGQSFGVGASSVAYPYSGYDIQNAIVNKEKWVVMYDKQIVLNPPEVKQFYSATGTHTVNNDVTGGNPTPLNGAWYNQATINGAGGSFDWPTLQSNTQNHPSVYKKMFRIPLNKKVKLDDRASGAIGIENLPLQYRVLVIQTYENASNGVNKTIITDVPTQGVDVGGQLGGPCINLQGNYTFTDA